jgi:beta-xylosidase
LSEASFLACQADANELLDLAQLDSSRLAASENYPVHKLRQIHSALRQRQLSLPVWLLSWNTLTGNTRDTNGRFFRGALLMDNLLGLADQVWLAGFWLNSGLQGEARANGKLDTSSLALHYLHGLPRPVYWVLWLWRRLRGEVLVNDKICCCYATGNIISCCYVIRWCSTLALQRRGFYPTLQPAL